VDLLLIAAHHRVLQYGERGARSSCVSRRGNSQDT